jgi:hypothetical protein
MEIKRGSGKIKDKEKSEQRDQAEWDGPIA